jgi:lambda family phage minor tail protein L
MSSADLFEDYQGLSVDAEVSLWTIDNTINGGTIYYFHSQEITGTSTDLTFDGQAYTAAPVLVKGVELNGNTSPRPKLSISTLAAVQLGLLEDPSLLLDAKCTRIRTLAKYLDGEPGADVTSIQDTIVFFVEHLESSTNEITIYKLAEPTELPDTNVPRQIVTTNLCQAQYRGETCQYAGDPLTNSAGIAFTGTFVDRSTWSATTSDYVAEDFVTLTSPDGTPFVFVALQSVPVAVRPGSSGAALYWSLDICRRTIAACKTRFPTHASIGLNFDAFPGSAKL